MGESIEDTGMDIRCIFGSNHHDKVHIHHQNSEEKSGSFLPKLDITHKYSNSSVIMREQDEHQKDMKDVSMRSSSTNWMNESFQKIHKKTLYQDRRKNPDLQTNHHVSDFSKVFKPQLKSNHKNSGNKSTNGMNEGCFNNLSYHDTSIQNLNIGNEYSKDYSIIAKNIGKMPLNEKLNEQAIRGKIYRDKFNQETPSKLEQVMINVTRGNNLQLIPLSEALSPINKRSPLAHQTEPQYLIKNSIEASSDIFHNSNNLQPYDQFNSQYN